MLRAKAVWRGCGEDVGRVWRERGGTGMLSDTGFGILFGISIAAGAAAPGDIELSPELSS